MTIIETYELLKNRLGFRAEGSFALDADLLTTQSGRVFQDEHTAVILKNIHATVDPEPADDAAFNKVLSDYRRQAVIHVISNVFDSTSIRNLDDHLSAFDTAISQRMAIVLLEMMINSTRSNLTERFIKNSNKWFYDLNGGAGNPNFPNLVGLKQRYTEEIRRLRDLFNSSEKTLDSYTLAIGNAEDDPILL